MAERARPGPVVLCILDGWGERADTEGNAIALAKTPTLDALYASCPHTALVASGRAVGALPGETGNGRTGHMVIGAGRPTPSVRPTIDDVIARRRISSNPVLDRTLRICMYESCALHLMGLLSDGGVHSDIDHLIAIIDHADFNEVPVVVHAFLDGRDVAPRSAMDYLAKLEHHIEGKKVTIGTLCGRWYAMDRDGRWDRTYQAFHAIVRDRVLADAAPRAETPYDAVSESYGRGVSDERLVPVRIGDYQGLPGDFMADFTAAPPAWEWTGTDCGFVYNFRGDRIHQLVAMLTHDAVPSEVAKDLLMDRDKSVRAFREHCLATMTRHGSGRVPCAFELPPLEATLGEVVSRAGRTQLRCAESEKMIHVTEFFNGGRSEPFAGERRVAVLSPRLVDRYDEKPAMSADKVARAVIDAIEAGADDLIVVNLANADAVGHSGDLQAAISAVQAVDHALGEIVARVKQVRGAMLLTGSHGNCEMMVDEGGAPHTAHTTSPVPLLYVDENDPTTTLREGGSLADVAPTLLEMLGLKAPAEMTGKSLRNAT